MWFLYCAEDYREALKNGEVKVTYARVMFIGPAGVGKSSLRRGLMNLELELKPSSTILADTFKVRFHWASAALSNGKTTGCWTEVGKDDEISELVGHFKKVKSNRSRTAEQLFAPISSVAEWLRGYLTQSNPRAAGRDYTKFVSEIKAIKEEIINKIVAQAQSVATAKSDDEPEVLIHIWDCGGQPVFLDVIPLFLTSRSVFLLLFNAAEDLNGRLKLVTRHEGEIICEEQQSRSQIDLLSQWMAAIHAQAQGGVAIAGQDSVSACTELPTHPKIIPVGTHGDQLAFESSDPEQRKKGILKQLDDVYQGKAFYDLFLDGPGVIVDNSTAGKGEKEDPGFEQIRNSIKDLAQSKLTVSTPINWVLFRKIFQEASDRMKKPIFKMQECLAIANECDIQVDSLPSVLNFYHQYGVLLYYGAVSSFREVVIANPQWLVDQFGKLLSIQRHKKTHGEKIPWKRLREEGILLEILYKEVWKDSGAPVPPQSLMDLLEHFLLAAPVKTGLPNHYDCREYFIPCMLGMRPDINTPLIRAQQPVKTAAPLHLVFNTGYIPPGFFVRLATSLTKHRDIQLLIPRGIHRNSITLQYGQNDRIDEITITELPNSIQLDIARCAPRKPRIPLFMDICCELLIIISECCNEVREWMPLIKVYTAFQSECSRAKHFLIFEQSCTQIDSYLQCRECGNRYNPSSEQQYWLKPMGRVSFQLDVVFFLSSLGAIFTICTSLFQTSAH